MSEITKAHAENTHLTDQEFEYVFFDWMGDHMGCYGYDNLEGPERRAWCKAVDAEPENCRGWPSEWAEFYDHCCHGTMPKDNKQYNYPFMTSERILRIRLEYRKALVFATEQALDID